MKTLKAKKCKDGYLVKITDILHIHTVDDVKKIIKQNGLEIQTETNTRIYAS